MAKNEMLVKPDAAFSRIPAINRIITNFDSYNKYVYKAQVTMKGSVGGAVGAAFSREIKWSRLPRLKNSGIQAQAAPISIIAGSF